MGQNFLWTDIETSGLDPDKNKILEIAVVATDNKLNILGEYSCILGHKNFDDMNDFVKKMHTSNGLIADCEKAYMNLDNLQSELIQFCKYMKLGDTPIMSGNSVHFDKYFIRRHLPDFDKTLHYRLLDVSSLKEMLAHFYDLKIPKDYSSHRAKNDVHASIEEFRKYTSILKINMLGY